MWFDFAIALSCICGGLICGWILHAVGGFGGEVQAAQARRNNAAEFPALDEPTRDHISFVAKRLRSYAIAMAADVDAHQTRVQAVNNSLSGDDFPTSPDAVLEAVNELIAANEQMQTQLQSAQERIHDQAAQIESAERRAHTDALTLIPNRGAFDTHLAKRHAQGNGQPTSLALLDVDHFKQFNDVYGHRAGDEVLRVVANMLNVRLESHGLVARFGGEEFAVVMDDCPIETARDLIESVRIAIGQRDIQFEDK
ncbi:MAG: GGDEF domain-containing protein, partial [Pirellulales bacterium]|nr:GGDEF domain-containing protein [Pirellulales bacterium]